MAAIIFDSEYGGDPVGRVENSGIVFDSEYGGDPVGRVENSGIVFDSEYGGDPIGRVEGFPLLKAGAAYILLLMNNNQS